MHKKLLPLLILLTLLAAMATFSVSAQQDVAVNINVGSGNSVWFITGEQTLVINGTNLNQRGLATPLNIRSISIAVDRPVTGASVEAVVYQDANGGSPADATLVGRQTFNITQSGVFTATFTTPLTITQPVIWFGFYLPVDFRFLADTSGASVLSYWGWTPNSTFNLAQLSSAAVLGPSDGSAPVNINMGGIARITATVSTSQVIAGTPGTAVATTQTNVVSGSNPNAAIMWTYPNCGAVTYDRDDTQISLRGEIGFTCHVRAAADAGVSPQNWVRTTPPFDIVPYKNGFVVLNEFPVPVTHCITPTDQNDLNRGVIARNDRSDRSIWYFLPTVRYGNQLCTELQYGGRIAVFVPIQQ